MSSLNQEIKVVSAITGARAIFVPSELYWQFQELIQRGANLWPDAHPSIKAFADVVTTGTVQQDYQNYSNSKP